jgi:transposase
VLPRRCVGERTLSWITRYRGTVRDYEWLAARHETYVYWAMIIAMTRLLNTAVGPRADGSEGPGGNV